MKADAWNEYKGLPLFHRAVLSLIFFLVKIRTLVALRSSSDSFSDLFPDRITSIFDSGPFASRAFKALGFYKSSGLGRRRRVVDIWFPSIFIRPIQ
jgi:hypothetical protein